MMNSVVSFFTIIYLMLGCGSNVTPTVTGTLEVKVSIGPLCGIVPANLPPSNNPCGLSDADMDAFYAGYELVVNSSQTNLVINEQKLNRTGVVSMNLPVGDYNVTVSPNPFPTLENKSPLPVKIVENQKTKVTISIQTGIR